MSGVVPSPGSPSAAPVPAHGSVGAAPGFGPPPGGPPPNPRHRRASYVPPGGLGSSTGVLPVGALRRYALPTLSRPGIIPLRPLGLSDILDGAVKQVRRNPGPVLGWAALTNCAAALPLVVGGLALSGSRSALGGLLGADWAMFFIVVTGVFFGLLMLTGILSYPLAEAVLGRRAAFGDIWRQLRPRLASLLGCQLLVAAVTILPWLVLVVVVTVINDASVVLVLLVALFGGVLALALNAWAVPRLLFIGPLIVLEGQSIRAAWTRSWELSRRRYWAIVGAFVTCAIIVLSVSWMIGLALGGALMAVLSVLELPYDANTIGEMIAVAVATIGTAALITPFLAGTTVLQYVDARMRAEGFDLVLLRAAADRVAATSGAGR